MAITLLIGAMPYALDDRGAALLVEWIRCWAASGEGLSGDREAVACLHLADQIERGGEEPIELGITETEALSAYVVRGYNADGHDGLVALHLALRRVRGDPN